MIVAWSSKTHLFLKIVIASQEVGKQTDNAILFSTQNLVTSVTLIKPHQAYIAIYTMEEHKGHRLCYINHSFAQLFQLYPQSFIPIFFV